MDPSLEPTQRSSVRDLTGQIIDGKYRVLRAIASGGFGIVYEVRRILLDEEQTDRLALKTIRPDLRGREDTIGRFRDEVLITHKLKTEYVCSVPDAGVIEDGELYYMVMEFAEGGSLEDRLREFWSQDENAPIEVVERWFRQCLLAMVEAERIGIVHRDLKPQNILLTGGGDIRVADFGIARRTGPDPQRKNLTGEHHWVGDRMWASPEQMMGEVSHRSDMYSLGATLHYALTREHPARTRPCQPSLRRKDVPAWMDQAIVRMTQPVPEERFETFADALETLPEPIEEDTGFWKKVSLATLLVAIAAAVLIWQLRPEPLGDQTWNQFLGNRDQMASRASECAKALDGLAVAELNQQWAAWQDAATERASAIAEARGDAKGEDKVPVNLIESLEAAQTRLDEITSDATDVSATLASLAEIRRLVDTRATSTSASKIDELEKELTTARVKKYAAVASEFADLKTQVARLAQTRREPVDALEARFATETDLEALAGTARELAEQNRALNEDDLADKAVMLDATARQLAAIELPALPEPGTATAEAPLAPLEPFSKEWFDRLTDTERAATRADGNASEDLLQAWWEPQASAIRTGVANRLDGAIQAVDAALRPRVAAHNAAVDIGLSEGQKREYGVLERCVRDLRAFAGDLPLWLRDQKAAIRKLCDEGLAIRSPRTIYTNDIKTFADVLAKHDSFEAKGDRDYGGLIAKARAAAELVGDELLRMEQFEKAPDRVDDPGVTTANRVALETLLDRIKAIDTGYELLAEAQEALEAGDLDKALRKVLAIDGARQDSPGLEKAAKDLEAEIVVARKRREAENVRKQTNPGVPDAWWEAWKSKAAEFAYPTGLKFDETSGSWFFPWRTLNVAGEERPVKMRLVTAVLDDRPRAWLVDVHQVVNAEFDALDNVLYEPNLLLIPYARQVETLKKRFGDDLDANLHRCRTMGVSPSAVRKYVEHWNRLRVNNESPRGSFVAMTQSIYDELVRQAGIARPQPSEPEPVRAIPATFDAGVGLEDLGTGLVEAIADPPSPQTENRRGMRAVFELTLF